MIIYLGMLLPTCSCGSKTLVHSGPLVPNRIQVKELTTLQRMGFTTTQCHHCGNRVDRETFHLWSAKKQTSIVSAALSLRSPSVAVSNHPCPTLSGLSSLVKERPPSSLAVYYCMSNLPCTQGKDKFYAIA